MGTIPRFALAGAAGAALWAVAEIPISQALGTGFTDIDLLRRKTGLSGNAGRLAAVTIHIANGAAFGAAFAAVGGRSTRQAVVAAEIEGAVLFPLMIVLDREHATRRVFVQEVVTHGLWGALLGVAAGTLVSLDRQPRPG